MELVRGALGDLPFLAAGSGPPLLFIGGLAPQAGVDAPGTAWMNGSLVAPFARAAACTSSTAGRACRAG